MPCSSLLPVNTNTVFERNRLGLFCFPTDPDEKNILLEKIGLNKRYSFMGIYDAMWRSFYISGIFAMVFVVLLHFFPLKVVPWTIAIGGIFSFVFGLVIMILSTGSIFLRLIFFILLVGLALACGYTLYSP